MTDKEVGEQIVDVAIQIHRELVLGLLEMEDGIAPNTSPRRGRSIIPLRSLRLSAFALDFAAYGRTLPR